MILIISVSSCSLLDSDNPIPSYIVVDNVNVISNPNQGEATHKILDVWAYADGQLLGVFELPTKIPVITNGEEMNYTLFPGIRNNGERSRSFTYNLMKQFDFTRVIEPGEEYKVTPTYSYNDNVKFDFVESFEGTSNIFTLELDGDPATVVANTTEDKRVGNKSGKISLTAEHPLISVGTTFIYSGENNLGSDAYFEMDYKNDVPLIVGVIYTQDGKEVSQPLLALNPTEEWNKIYVDYTSILTSPAIVSYRPYFTTDLDPIGVSEGTIYLDNLKFIHL